MHDEREMDRVLEIEGVEIIGINNRNLGDVAFLYMIISIWYLVAILA